MTSSPMTTSHPLADPLTATPAPVTHRPRAMGENHGVLWVPTEAVVCHLVAVPKVPRSKWQAMIPWLLEDQLLEAPAQLAFRMGERIGDGRVPVLVTSREQLAAWQLAGATELVPDFFALPWRQGECALALLGDRAVLRLGPWQGAAGPPALIWSLVENHLSRNDEQLLVFARHSQGQLPPGLAARSRVEDLAQLFDRPCTPWLGFTSATVRATPVGARALGLSLGLGLLALVLLMVTVKVETVRMEAQAGHLEAQLQAVYGQHFGEPYDFAMADFQSVVSRQLEGGALSGPSPLTLLAPLASILPACTDCRIEKLSADQGGLTLEISGSAPQVTALPLSGNGWHGRVTALDDHWQYRIEGGNAHE